LYGKPGLRALLHITYHDGTTDRVNTNDGWRWKQSGLTMSNLFLGDYMDYRLWDTEWEKPGMSSSWKPVQSVKPLSPKLIAQDFPPIRIVREIDPIKTWQVGEKIWAKISAGGSV
jgi:alpha-L-rhamnosidase